MIESHTNASCIDYNELHIWLDKDCSTCLRVMRTRWTTMPKRVVEQNAVSFAWSLPADAGDISACC